MHILGSIVLVMFTLAPAAARAEAPYQVHVSGAGAQLAFAFFSADGCVETSGSLSALQVRAGEGLPYTGLAFGTVEDHCTGAFDVFYGATEGTFRQSGLQAARFQGTIVTDSYTGLAPLTLEIDLAWTGKGAVSHTRSSFRSTGPGWATLSFQCASSRAANVTGGFSIDGRPVAAAEVSWARLVAETDGELSVARPRP